MFTTIDRDNGDFWTETKGLLKHERNDRTQLRALRKQLRQDYPEDSWPLLLDLLIADSTKHIKILPFVLKDSYP